MVPQNLSREQERLVVFKNILTFAHNSVVIVAVLIIFDVNFKSEILLSLIGLALLIVNGIWCALLLGLLCARYRDLNPTISSLIQLSFFVTPIIWEPSLLPDRQFVLLYNPFYHFIECIRGPILGNSVHLTTWIIVIGITITGWCIVILVAAKAKRKLVYWL